MMEIKNRPFFCSWSGGKDSCFALYHALRAGGQPRYLFTMLSEEGEHSRAHALPLTLLRKQAAALGIPLVTAAASWDDYERVYTDQLREFQREGVEVGVFGDIDLEEHRQWVERVCAGVGLEACLPLWKRRRRELVEEFIDLGFRAVIVVVKEERMDARFLGRVLDRPLLAELEREGVDAAGENGEYHTVITGGPLFAQPLRLEVKGRVSRDGYAFLEVE
ncbi:MAG: Putative ATP binding protein [Thermacetogenium phaeum]|uniref:Putative ATP binding protein n=1 Tax=Thermacetogenium phaeum TaxID=85874 RepID=A0A101FEW1_9THEO|nr:MAG: Putative ATP binding protein [Thermacetogenium phaeum]